MREKKDKREQMFVRKSQNDKKTLEISDLGVNRVRDKANKAKLICLSI